jgi:hypothetical protein
MTKALIVGGGVAGPVTASTGTARDRGGSAEPARADQAGLVGKTPQASHGGPSSAGTAADLERRPTGHQRRSAERPGAAAGDRALEPARHPQHDPGGSSATW